MEIIKAEERRIKRIHLGVLASNQTAVSFWHSHGFKPFTHTMYLERPYT